MLPKKEEKSFWSCYNDTSGDSESKGYYQQYPQSYNNNSQSGNSQMKQQLMAQQLNGSQQLGSSRGINLPPSQFIQYSQNPQYSSNPYEYDSIPQQQEFPISNLPYKQKYPPQNYQPHASQNYQSTSLMSKKFTEEPTDRKYNSSINTMQQKEPLLMNSQKFQQSQPFLKNTEKLPPVQPQYVESQQKYIPEFQNPYYAGQELYEPQNQIQVPQYSQQLFNQPINEQFYLTQNSFMQPPTNTTYQPPFVSQLNYYSPPVMKPNYQPPFISQSNYQPPFISQSIPFSQPPIMDYNQIQQPYQQQIPAQYRNQLLGNSVVSQMKEPFGNF